MIPNSATLLDPPRAPPILRRLLCMVYEGVVLFGVVMFFGYLYGSLTQQRNALQGRHGLQAFLFVVLAIYFVWFWTRGGQTVAMKTWQIRLVAKGGKPVGQARALLRYLLAWLWFMPALAASWLAGWQGGTSNFVVLAIGVAAYAGTAGLRPDRQFVHDAICGTFLADQRGGPRSGPDPASTAAASR